MQASVSAAAQRLQATPGVQCNSWSSSFFFPFLGTAILSAMLLACIITICGCLLCVSWDQKVGKKKGERDMPLDRPTESEPPILEPPGNVYDSGSGVPSSVSAIPGTVVTERDEGESAPVVESSYSSVTPKVVYMAHLCILCCTVMTPGTYLTYIFK